MNYLGHAVLSFGDPELLTGNLIADHVKGRLALERFPAAIKEGILLHRRIDQFTDEHPASMRAKLFFRETYGLYAGAIVDSLYDHFLANDPKHFNTEQDLLGFTQDVYAKLDAQTTYFPEVFASYFPFMKQQNWLFNYRNLQGMQRSLQGLHRRAMYMAAPDEAYKIFVQHYYQLAQCYYELIDDMVSFVKLELTKNKL
jgi:acyl carrier protein phosphodiesterase